MKKVIVAVLVMLFWCNVAFAGCIEGKGGTQKMLKRCKSKKFKNQGVLVKFPKKKQDLRIDLPTVGFKTLIQCKSAGLKGIVLKSKQNVFLERKKCINFANKNKMFIIAK